MKISTFPLAVLPMILAPFASGASVQVGACQTNYASPTGTTAVNTSTTQSADLSDLTGLTAGKSIKIDFTPNAALFWLGKFGADDGNLLINWTAEMQIAAGGFSITPTETWSLGPLTYDGDGMPVTSYSFGPAPVTHSFIVPWGTDLSNVTFTLRDHSNITAPNGKIYESSLFRSAATFTTQSVNTPEIQIERADHTDIPSGSTVDFGTVATAASVSLTLTIKNTGLDPLNGLAITTTGADLADFTVTVAPTAPVSGPTGTTDFTLRFSPATSGAKTATIHIANDDLDENPFNIVLTGLSLSPVADTDADGLNDFAEYQLAPLGYNWQVSQPALVNTLMSNANLAGLYTQPQVQALNVDAPLLTRNPATGKFLLTLGIQKSTDLIDFAPFPFTVPETSINPQGKLEFEFIGPGNAAFFRVQAK